MQTKNVPVPFRNRNLDSIVTGLRVKLRSELLRTKQKWNRNITRLQFFRTKTSFARQLGCVSPLFICYEYHSRDRVRNGRNTAAEVAAGVGGEGQASVTEWYLVASASVVISVCGLLNAPLSGCNASASDWA